MKVMALDYGDARTGVAVSDPSGMIVGFTTVISEWNREKAADKVAALVQEKKPERLIMGFPKNMDGSEGDSAKNARSFGELLKQKTGLELIMQDERGTTMTAHRYLNETNTRGKKRKAVVDSVAAVIILQDYLDSERSRL